MAFSRLQPVAELPNCLSKSFCHSHMHKMGAEAYKSRSLALHIRIQNSMLRFLGIAQKLATYFIKIKVRRLWKTKGNQMKFNVCKVFWDNWMLVLQASCYAFSLATSLSFASLCLTVHFARVFRAALPSTTSPSSLPTHSVLLTPHCKNCNSILCDLLLPHCLPPLFFASSVYPSPSLCCLRIWLWDTRPCGAVLQIVKDIDIVRPSGPLKNHSSCVQHNKIKLTHRWLQSSRCQLSATPTPMRPPPVSLPCLPGHSNIKMGTKALKHYR